MDIFPSFTFRIFSVKVAIAGSCSCVADLVTSSAEQIPHHADTLATYFREDKVSV